MITTRIDRADTVHLIVRRAHHDTMTHAPPFRIAVLYRGGLPRHVCSLLQSVSEEDPLLQLVRTIASTGTWRPQQPLALVVCTGPQPLLATVGRIGPRDEAMLAALRWQLDTVLPRLRYVDQAEVTDACVRLADQLVERLGADLDRAVFTAIPRGGLIVLGQLAYALGLRHDQLAVDGHTEPSERARPLVVVDDCLLSGVRMTRFLDAVQAPRVVVAALASPPDLRHALLEKRAAVEHVLSSIDLHDHAPDLYGAEYGSWLGRWRERSGPDALWIGQPEHVCFPWHEPDVGVWDPDARDVVRGWGMLPGELCLAQRQRASAHGAPWPIHVISAGDATSRIPAGVVHASFGDTVVVGHVDQGTSVALEGVAASMWRVLTTYDDERSAVAALAEHFDAEPATLRNDLRAFTADLVAHGLLRPVTVS